jgi:hypothetical protein
MALVSATFYDRKDADMAVERLRTLGYGTDQISVIMTAATRERHFVDEEQEGDVAGRTEDAASTQRAALGSVVGGTLGALVLGGVVFATVVTAGAGALIAGALAAAGGAIGGGAAGGVIGGVVAGGLPPESADAVLSDVEAGAIAVIVDVPDERVAEVHSTLARFAAS